MPHATVFVRQNLDRLLLVVAVLAGAMVPVQSPDQSSLGAYLAGALGLIAVHERLRAEFSRHVAIVATLLVFAGTSLFWSMARTTSFIEAGSFGLVAAVALVTARLRRVSAGGWLLVAVLPFALRYLSGYSFTDRDVAPAFIHAPSPLFSSSHGLLSLTPVAYVAVVGTLLYLRRNILWAASTLGVVAIWITAHEWLARGSDGPSGHGLTPALAILAPGLAFLIDRARARPLVAVAPVIAAALLWNYWLMVQYTVGTLPKDAPVSFADMVRQQAEVHTRSPYVYLFAFPANAWFAWREGVPAERYEVLSVEPRRPAIDLVMDRQADRFLLEGWDAPGPDAMGPVHWIGERRASIALPLDLPAGRAIEVLVTARARLEEPAINADMGLEVNGHEIGRFVATSATPVDARMTVPAVAVGQIFRAGYNRFTLISYGVHRADAADQREPGPLASRGGSRAWPVAISRIRVAPATTP